MGSGEQHPSSVRAHSRILKAIKKRDVKRGLAVSVALAGLMGVTLSLNYTNHAALLPVLLQDLHLGPTAGGLLSSGLFAASTAITVPAGAWSDRYGPRIVMAAGAAVLALVNLLLLFTQNYAHLLGGKALLGFGTGLCFIAGLRFTEAVAPPGKVHLWQGLFGGFVQLGAGLGLYGVPILLRWFSWRQTFLLLGILTTGTLIVWWLAAPTGSRPLHRSHQPMLAATRSVNAWLLSVGHCAGFGIAFVAGTWITSMLVARFALTLEQAGATGSVILVAGLVVRPLGGWVTARGYVRSRHVLQTATALTFTGLVLMISRATPLPLFTVGALLLGVGVNLSYSAVFVSASATHPDYPGATQGFISTVGTGFVLLGAPLVGWAVSRTGEFGLGIFGMAVYAAVATIACFWVRDDQDAMTAAARPAQARSFDSWYGKRTR